MTAPPAPTTHDRQEPTGVVAVEIDMRNRWDALALSELLLPFRSFLVERGPRRWVVHARAPGCHGEPLAEALRLIERWRDERAVESTLSVHGRPREDRP